MKPNALILPKWARVTINTLLAVLVIWLILSAIAFVVLADTTMATRIVRAMLCLIGLWLAIKAFKVINPE